MNHPGTGPYRLSCDIGGNSPTEFAKVVREDSARWAKVVEAANVQL